MSLLGAALLSSHHARRSCQVVREYLTEGQKHTTGLAIHEDTLFVACQELGEHIPDSLLLQCSGSALISSHRFIFIFPFTNAIRSSFAIPGTILSFDVKTSRFLSVAASSFPDTIERLELSDC
jgi:hypothetical protein